MRTAFGFLASLLLVALALPARADDSQQWLAVSDIHFDPLADPRLADRLNTSPAERWRAILSSDQPAPFSGYGADTNFALLESALEAMRNITGVPRVVVITGDFLSDNLRARFDTSVHEHDDAHYRTFAAATMNFLAAEFRQAFPRSQFVIALGNSDSDCGEDALQPSSAFLAGVASSWGASVGMADANRFLSDFATGGYYTVPLPAGNAEALVLNDTFWSPAYQNRCGDSKSNPGNAELNWMQSTARGLRGKRVWTIAHISPGIDAYASYHGNPQTAQLFLTQQYNDALIAALDSFDPNATVMLAGHTHMNGFRIVGPDPSRPQVPVLMIPALSPAFANNPSFTVLRVNDADAQIADAQYFILDDLAALAKDGRYPVRWRREFAFDSVFGHGMIDVAHLNELQVSILTNDRVRRRYEEYYDSDSGRAPMTDQSWRFFWCADVALTVTTYNACALPQVQRAVMPHPSAPPTATPAP